MHEYSIVAALLQKVGQEAARAGATRVQRLWVRIGELSGVEIELFETAYRTFRDRSICENAELRVRTVAARWECPTCRETIRAGARLSCTACGASARLAEGDEIFLDRIEMEVRDV